MAILSTIVKDFIRQKTESGYITLKPKTDADCVSYINSDAVKTDVQTELDELNSNLSELLNKLKDYIIIKTVTTGNVSVGANTGAQPSYTIPSVDGYKLMYRFGVPNGNAGIIVQPNSTWIYNPTHSNATVTVTYYCVFVRDL